MSISVCLAANTLRYPTGGGHLWVYLNWALGLRSLGCQVVWLEAVGTRLAPDKAKMNIAALKRRLEPYGLSEQLAIHWVSDAVANQRELSGGGLGLDAAVGADLLLNINYGLPADIVQRFRRTALVDIDPGLLQTWISAGSINVAPHDLYFTIGETVGQPQARFSDAGLRWHYTPPCIALDWWPEHPAPADAPFSTVSHWHGGWMVDETGTYRNDKRTGFQPYLELPRLSSQPLELALCLGENEEDQRLELQQQGWRVGDAHTLTATPWDYQRYIQASRGEFSCAKPAYVRLQTTWISDRTPCYLASGKPAVVQHTGPSRFLPDAEGIFRFRTLEEAVQYIEMAAADYQRQCRLARTLAEEYFDARKVIARVLERALA